MMSHYLSALFNRACQCTNVFSKNGLLSMRFALCFAKQIRPTDATQIQATVFKERYDLLEKLLKSYNLESSICIMIFGLSDDEK